MKRKNLALAAPTDPDPLNGTLARVDLSVADASVREAWTEFGRLKENFAHAFGAFQK